MDFKRFAGKTAIVTGAASGIGRAVALALAEEGASIAIADVDRGGGEDAVRVLVARGARAIFVEADVARGQDVQRIVDHALSTYGRLDVLINNAGVESVGPIGETAEADWDRVISVNLKSAYLLSKAALPYLEKNGGAIVNVASVAGLRAPRRSVAYVVSKSGLIGLTKALSADHSGRGVRVNAVAPGMTDTPMLRRSAAAISANGAAAVLEAWGNGIPAGRTGTAEEVASAIVFLASPEASFITGAVLDVDGGTLASL